MNIRIYSTFDRKARSFGALMAFVNDEVARRVFLGIIKGDGEIRNFPGDFDVFHLGTMDTDSGVITPQVPVLAFNCGDLAEAQEV